MLKKQLLSIQTNYYLFDIFKMNLISNILCFEKLLIIKEFTHEGEQIKEKVTHEIDSNYSFKIGQLAKLNIIVLYYFVPYIVIMVANDSQINYLEL